MRFIRKTMSRIYVAGFSCLLLLTMGIVPGIYLKGSAAQLNNHHDHQVKAPFNMTVILKRVYLDGEISEEVVREKGWSMENFWAKYDQWQLTNIDGATMVFKRNVDDISPLLKANGYFGITDDGVLTIFNGRPDRSRIIQSFFQIDIKKLESKKQEELLQGIPIKNKDRYVEVLETFKQYSKE
jgi:forespore regulator of the sigma-K checkpoint